MASVWRAVPARFTVARCTCGAPIVWHEEPSGRRLALDRRRERRIAGVLELEAHWAYCQHRRAHSRRGKIRAEAKRPRCALRECTRKAAEAGTGGWWPFCGRHLRRVPLATREEIQRRRPRAGLPDAAGYHEVLKLAALLIRRSEEKETNRTGTLFEEPPARPDYD